MGKKIQLIGRYSLEGQLLGKGSFARVELAHHTVTGCKVAIKIIDTRKLKEEYQKNNLHREARILGQLRHPNIIRLYETLKATTLHCLVLEYASGGELQHFIKLQKDFRLSEDRARPYVRQLVSALHYLHERGVAHRDIKMENIMLDTPKTNVKLIDFGLSNTFAKDELMKTHCGSPEYAAPELFTAGEKYGLEIDIWSLGVVMYAIMVGKLPFTTPYTDQYRRQKLVQQMEKGLVDAHNQEMCHLSTDCQDLLHKVIEPCPSLRLSLLDMEIHPWFTEQAKRPFFPFQSFPRDKLMKTQTYDELATALSMRKEVLEQKVAENKCDELSAMFNMILDKKRQQQGLFDVDHTIKSTEKKETKGKRSKSAHAKNEKGADKKHVHKGPPALILPCDDNTAESAPHSGNEADHETKFSSFDFLALCSTPTWLGPERRKSRRRSRSPMPSPHVLQHGSQGLSVRSQMKRDYMERQALEQEREMIREERAAAAGLLSPTNDSRQQSPYNDHHIPVSTSLSVPGSEPISSNHNAFRRSSSFKLSRRRARSCGPSQRRKSSFQRSGSVDHHSSDKEGNSNLSAMFSTIRDGRSAPVISGEGPLHRGNTKTASLKIRRNSTAGSHSIVACRKQSVDFADTVRNSLLGVPNYDMHKNNLLTVPFQGSNNSILKNLDAGIESKNLLQVPSLEMGSNPLLCVPNQDNENASIDDTQLSPTGLRAQSATRPGKLILKECYPPPVENSKISSHLLPLLKPLISGPNGPLTSVEVHYVDSSNPSSSVDLLQASSQIKKDALDVQHNDKHNIAHLHKNDYFSLDVASKHSLEEELFDVNSDKKYQKQSRIESISATSFPLQSRSLPPHSKSTHLNASRHLTDRAPAMQFEDKSNGLAIASETNILLGAEGPVFVRKDSITDLEHHFDGLLLSSECLEENEDHVDSMTELISDTFREDILANAKPPITSSIALADSKVHRQNSSITPDDDLIMKRAGSGASFSKNSGSGRKGGSGKAKSPTTPTWLNLRTPLARIESFHSDDFECFADSDNDDHESNSSMSATTPTVPCFAYKLHVMKKKQTKLKSSGNGKQSGCGCGTKQNSDYLSSKLNRNSVDKKQASITSGHTRLDAAVTDPLLSSGSETEQHEDGQERLRAPGQSKIHPMGTDDRDAETLNKSDAKCFSYHNAITKQPNQIKNAINRLPRIVPDVEQGTKKRAFVKHLAWRKSFAQFLKRKRYHSPLLTAPQKQQNQLIHRHHQQNQQLHQHHHHQQPSPSNNNNNDLGLSDPVPESRNGISALSQLQTKTLDISAGTEDIVANSQEGDSFKVAASTLSTVPVENIVTGWGTCRECGSEDISSDEENDYMASGDPTTVMMNLKPLGENNVHESINCSQIYQLSST